MADLILTQTDNAAGCGAVVGCSGATIASTPQAREATKDGSPGVTELEILIALDATQAGIMFQSANNEPGKTTWEAGDWIVRLNVTTGSDRITWVATYVCRFDNVCGSLAVVGSLTGQSISCELTGVKQMTVSGAEQSANLSDEVYIVLIFANSFTHGERGIGFTPDQNIDTPIVLAGEDIVKIINETLQSSEGTLRPRVMARVYGETLQLDEGIVRLKSMVKIIGETLNIQEGVVKVKTIIKIIGETLQINEGILRIRSLARIIGETLQLNEGILNPRVMLRHIDETLSISEGITRLKKMVRKIDETLQLSEGISKILGFVRVVNETLNIQEGIVRLTGLFRWISEGLSIQEGILRSRELVRLISEAVNLQENILRTRKMIRLIGENVSISEGSLARRTMMRIVNETIELAEGIIKKLTPIAVPIIKVINEALNISEGIFKSVYRFVTSRTREGRAILRKKTASFYSKLLPKFTRKG